MHLRASPDATILLAACLTMYAPLLSTLVGSFPEKAPPPSGSYLLDRVGRKIWRCRERRMCERETIWEDVGGCVYIGVNGCV
ncbi:hypothetical protein Hdeb2414_s0002g00075891 [Helianthus debilis subsp. tardiflorus]